MLIQFEVDNFNSIKDTVTFNMQSTLEENNHSFKKFNYNLLQTAVIYGANASGKSNLLKAMNQMTSLVLNRDGVNQSTSKIEHQPFLLNSETQDASTSFEIIFIVEEIVFRYGFEYDSETIYSEWLFSSGKVKRESKLFFRDIEDDEFYVNSTKFKEGRGLEKKTLPNHLFLWKCDSENGEIAKKIMHWFSNFNIIDGIDNRGYLNYTNNKLKDKSFKEDILNLVKVADLGISDITTHEEKMSSDVFEEMNIPANIKESILRDGGLSRFDTLTQHKKFDKQNNFIGNIEFDLNENESLGTQKFFAMSAPIIDTLKYGKVLIIDELDASLHPILTMHLIKMFHNKEINKHNAQLIFATHDTNLLQSDLLYRDQIYFTEKNKYGATDLYSLLEYKEISTRKDTNKEKYYLQGRYGAIPFIGEFNFKDTQNES
ncbi:MAG: ATP-binding protein [Campylobacterota bacterium]|nr:ATP-binding protein [Campylobacterota bacterium]